MPFGCLNSETSVVHFSFGPVVSKCLWKVVLCFSSSTTYWLYDDDRDILIGASNLRDNIVGESGLLWGNVGYGIRPGERKKGFATYLLKETLEKARKKGFNNIYAGTYVGNVGSWKVMEKCGFEFEKIIMEDATGLPVKVYKYNLGESEDGKK